jgi:hypothetical protein
MSATSHLQVVVITDRAAAAAELELRIAAVALSSELDYHERFLNAPRPLYSSAQLAQRVAVERDRKERARQRHVAR